MAAHRLTVGRPEEGLVAVAGAQRRGTRRRSCKAQGSETARGALTLKPGCLGSNPAPHRVWLCDLGLCSRLSVSEVFPYKMG